MSFSIYGFDLIPGCCEVHPLIHEPYPCSLCLIEIEHANREEAAYTRDINEQYARDMAEMFATDMMESVDYISDVMV